MLTYPRTKRASSHELLDSPSPNPEAAAVEFRFLRRLNRATASSDGLLDAIHRRLRPMPGQEVTLVDFGTGTGEIAVDAAHKALRQGWSIAATLTDHSDDALQRARTPARAFPGVRFERFDLVRDSTPLKQAPFLISHTSLVLHHFSDEDVVRALSCMSTQTSGIVVWNDLVRDRIGTIGAQLATLAGNSALRHDAVLSVRRSFTLAEARAFAEAAGLVDIEIRRWRGARFILTARPAPKCQPFPAPRPLIRARELHFAFGDVSVLHNRSFVLRSGEIGLAAGPNGSGKTTTLRLLAGVLRPNSGDAWCDTCEGPIGYLPQRGGLIASLSITANLDAQQRIAGIAPADREPRVRDAIERFGLAPIMSRCVRDLSVGQARCAAIASVWATAGRVLLLDEPDAGLDADSRERLGLALADHAKVGGSALVTSHEWSWLERVCDLSSVSFVRSVCE